MSIPRVSVLVPICNVEKYLYQCLESLVNQTLKDIEIICINDGSTDSSLSIINDFAKNDKRIVIVDKPNSGYGDSMNCGLRIAKGEYIGIVESDDFVDRDMFEQLYELTSNGSIDIVRSNYYKYWHDKGDAESFHAESSNYEKIIDFTQEKELLMIPPAIWSAIYRKGFLVDNKINFLPTPGASYQDTSFFIKTLFMAKKVIYTESRYLHYRQDNAFSSVKQCALAKALFVHTEFDEADQYLKRFPERYALVENIYNTKKLKTFLWNLCRVDDKKGYLKIMLEASRDILNTNNYDKRYFTELEHIILKCLKNNSVNKICILLKIKKFKQVLIG